MPSRVYASVERPSVRPSIRLSHPAAQQPHDAAAGLLLWARRPGDIFDQFLHCWRSAAAAPQHGAQQQGHAAIAVNFALTTSYRPWERRYDMLPRRWQ